MRLTLARVSDIAKGEDVREIKVLDASKNSIDALDDLSACVELRKLNLSENELESIADLAHCRGLTWLNVSHNRLATLRGVEKMMDLNVLNASHNEIAEIVMARLRNLKALVLNNNRISSMEAVASMSSLNTIVLSHNKISEIKGTRTLKALTKLSVAHNRIRVVPDLSDNSELVELRLNDNKIMRLPDTLSANTMLKTVDFGNNLIKTFADIAVLGTLRHVTNINLKGNAVCQLEGYADKIREMCPTLLVLDGKRVIPRKSHVRRILKEAAAEERAKKGDSRNRGDRQTARSKHTASDSGDAVDAAEGEEEKAAGSGSDDASDEVSAPSKAHPKQKAPLPSQRPATKRERDDDDESSAQSVRRDDMPATKRSRVETDGSERQVRERGRGPNGGPSSGFFGKKALDGPRPQKHPGARGSGQTDAAVAASTAKGKGHAQSQRDNSASLRPTSDKPTGADAAVATANVAKGKRKADTDDGAGVGPAPASKKAKTASVEGGADSARKEAAEVPQVPQHKTQSGVVAVEHVTRPGAKGAKKEAALVDPSKLFAWGDDSIGLGGGW